MSLFKMAFKLLFVSKQNGRTLVSLAAIQKMLSKNVSQEIELILIKQKQYNLDSFV